MEEYVVSDVEVVEVVVDSARSRAGVASGLWADMRRARKTDYGCTKEYFGVHVILQLRLHACDPIHVLCIHASGC